MTLRNKITLGCVAACVLFIAGCIIYGCYVNSHFERGSAKTYGVITYSAKKHHPERSYRVNHRLVHNAAYDETILRYRYTVAGLEYDGKTTTRHVIPRLPSVGDSILVTYALDKPSLSRTGSQPTVKRAKKHH